MMACTFRLYDMMYMRMACGIWCMYVVCLVYCVSMCCVLCFLRALCDWLCACVLRMRVMCCVRVALYVSVACARVLFLCVVLCVLVLCL